MTDAAKAQAEDDCSDERSIPANSMSPFVAPLRRAVVPQLCLIAGLDGSEVHAIKANDPKRTSAGTAQGTRILAQRKVSFRGASANKVA